MRKKYIYWLLFACCLICSCKQQRQYFPEQPSPAELEIVRFDRAILSLNTPKLLTDSTEMRIAVEEMYAEYPYFSQVWTEDILGIPSEDTAYLCKILPEFLTDTLYGFAQTNKKCEEEFAEISKIEDELRMAFGRLGSIFELEYPTIYFFISGFNSSILGTDDDGIAVGVDMYLGSDYEYYNRVVYDYQKLTMRKECIPVDVMSYYLFSHIGFESEKSRLLDQMIYRGKIMYLTAQLFPEEKPWEVMGYTEEKWKWCVRNEKNIWGLMMDRKDLYKTEQLILTGYLNDGPFTSCVSQESPSRLGTWIGWQIVESYMNNNPSIGLAELIAENDAQKVLELSNYRPK